MGFALVKRGSNGEDRGLRGDREGSRATVTMRAENANQFRQREPTRIGEFIQRQIVGIQPGGRPVRLVLRHLEVGNRPGQRVGSDSVMGLNEDEIGKMAIGIYDLAESDAIGLGNASQKYVLLSYDEESPTADPSGRVIFEVQTGMQRQGEDERYPQYLDSNPPTEQGVLSQVMNQNKELLNKVLQVVNVTSGAALALQGQVDRLMERVAEEEKRRFQNFDTLERARSEQWMREKEARILEAEVDGKKQLFGMLKDVVAPAIVRRMGASDPNQRIRADDEQEMKLAVSLAGDRYEKIMSILADDQAASFAFAEWFAFNAERAAKLAQAESAQAAPSQTEQKALPASTPTPAVPTPPSPEELEKLRLANITQAQEQAVIWSERLKALEAQRAAVVEGEKKSETTVPVTKKSKKAAAEAAESKE